MATIKNYIPYNNPKLKYTSVVYLLVLCTSMLFLSACSKTLYPKAPIESYQNYSPKSVLSTIALPLQIPLLQIEKQLNSQVKGMLYELKNQSSSDYDRFNLKVSKQEDIKLSGNASSLKIAVPLRVRLDGTFEAEALGFSISETATSDFAIKINFATKIGISPQWQLQSQTTIENYQWLVKPTIDIRGFSLPIDFIADLLLKNQKEYIAKKIDEALSSQANLKGEVSQVWTMLQKPILLSEEYNTWLTLKPEEIQMKPIGFENNTLQTTVAMRMYANSYIGANPPNNTSNLPLKNLQLTNQISPQFQITLQNHIDRQFAIEEVKKQFVGQTYTQGKKKITITNINLYGSEGNMVLAVSMMGSLNGTAYFEGLPTYDEASQSIMIKNLDFSLDTKNLLAKSAAWLFDKKINKLIAESLKMPLKTSLEDLKKEIQKNLTNYPLGEVALLNGKLDQLKMGEVAITPDKIILNVLATGNLQIKMK